MSGFQHFIITQFNLRNFPKSSHNDNDKWIDWTKNRIGIFREFCLPSLINQSVKDFTWLLYFDSETPSDFKPVIDELSAIPFIEICYCNGMEDFLKNYMVEVKKRFNSSSEWIITTRIDNDDCLHADAIKTIQNNFIPENKFLIALSSGYVLNAADKTLSHYFYPQSPFLTLIERKDENIKGVFEKGHTKWDELRLFVIKEIRLEIFNKKARRARFILKKPLWIQIVHGGNVSNSFYRGLPVLQNRDLHQFSLNFSSKKLGLKVLPKYYQYVTWKRYFKSWIIKCLIGK
jgi:hypothetical protein